MTFLRIVIRFSFLFEHDLFRKPLHTFRDHALALGARELVGAALERIVDGQRLGVGERQVLHQDHARNATARIDPEIGVVDAAPAQAAGGALAWYLIGGDEETQSPLVPAVRDEGEVGAARQRGLERLIQKLMERGAGS